MLAISKPIASGKSTLAQGLGNCSRTTSYGHLMFSESRVVISTMLRLAREHNIPAVPVYDSLIVPRSKEEVAERVLNEQFIKIIGVKPTLKIRPLPARYF